MASAASRGMVLPCHTGVSLARTGQPLTQALSFLKQQRFSPLKHMLQATPAPGAGAGAGAGRRRRRSALDCRAVLDTPPTPAGQEPADTAKPLREDPLTAVPSCCSQAPEEEPSPALARAQDQSFASTTSSSEALSRALLLGAAVALPAAVLYSNPSLLPFDIDVVQDWLDEAVYFVSHEANRTLTAQLGGDNPLAPGLLGLVFGAGIATSFAPCTLSVLPFTIGYIAGFNADKPEEQRQAAVLLNATFFALGLAFTFSSLGITAALAGKAYGQMGPGLPIAVSAVTMYMGLNLLGLVQFRVPSAFANFDAKEAAAALPEPVQMLLGGMTFALLASPCSTPVLASLLGYVASSEDVVVGFALLMAYTFGRVTPILVAASFTGSMRQMLSLRQYSRWINPASGALLLGIGTFSMLNRVFPEATAMALSMGPM